MGPALRFTPFAVNNAELLFREKLAATFGAMDWQPIADGSIHRFHVPGDKPGTLNGWYVLFADGIAAGSFGSWKTGGCHTWSSREPADRREADHLRWQMEQARRQREAEQRQRQQATAEYARWIWDNSRYADPAFPYLTAKGCRPYNLRQRGNMMLAPMYYAGQLVNLQRIAADGSKRFLSGGRVKGCYSPLGRIQPGQPLYVCEGWATGATLHENTGHPVACAMNAGNLLSVGQQLQRTYPDALLIFAGDDDRQTKGNPGRSAATDAAKVLGALLTFPEWPASAPLSMTDFNDLANWRATHEC